MIQTERCTTIYQLLQKRGSVSTRDLQKHLFASEATIRRDLEAMERQGLLKRVWGGAMLVTSEKDIPSFVRQKTNQDKKEKIAQIASQFLHHSMTIFMDSSTTCLALVPYLAQMKDLTIITSSLKLSRALGDQTNASINLLGGRVYEGYILSGYQAIQSIREYNSDVLFFSCSGISIRTGITSIEPRVIEVVREMMLHTEKKILLCDTSKIGKTAPLRLTGIETLDYVIMDDMPDPDSGLTSALGEKLVLS